MLSTASLSNIQIFSYCFAHVYSCRKCFFPLTTHKFRRALEPNVNPKPDGPRKTALRPAGNLLVGFSGGLGSSVLVDLVHRCYIALDKSTMPAEGGRDHPRHERVWKKITVCYIEVSDAFPGVSASISSHAFVRSDRSEVDEGKDGGCCKVCVPTR